MKQYYSIIVPTNIDGKNLGLREIQATNENVQELFDKQSSGIVLRWLDYGYLKVAQKNFFGFIDKPEVPV